MGYARPLLFPLIMALLSGCGEGAGDGPLCERTFVPYTDLISGQVRTPKNAAYLDGMDAYRKGDHAAAEALFRSYLSDRAANKSAHLYLACSYLALGRPYDAELQLDHLEKSNLKGFKDQCEWYTVVCWLCSGQLPRALGGAQAIADTPRHTYKADAKKLVAALRAEGVE